MTPRLLVKVEPKTRGEYCCLQLHGLSCPNGPYTLKTEAVTTSKPSTTLYQQMRFHTPEGLKSSCFGARNILRRREATGGWRKYDSIMRRRIITILQSNMITAIKWRMMRERDERDDENQINVLVRRYDKRMRTLGRTRRRLNVNIKMYLT